MGSFWRKEPYVMDDICYIVSEENRSIDIYDTHTRMSHKHSHMSHSLLHIYLAHSHMSHTHSHVSYTLSHINFTHSHMSHTHSPWAIHSHTWGVHTHISGFRCVMLCLLYTCVYMHTHVCIHLYTCINIFVYMCEYYVLTCIRTCVWI